MAAFDIPWLDVMSTPSDSKDDTDSFIAQAGDPNPPTLASFSPVTLSNASNANKQRSTILVHQKSPLLIATPPQITRSLAYSHPFLLPLNKFVGLLTWTSGDPWESFLLVASFWAVVLYGGFIMRWAGPIVVVLGLILGMYSRRYSPLSSTGWTGEKQKGHKREISEATNIKHQKTLDEIVETLKVFTSRCNVLLDPLLNMTDFLSTQRTATSATTRPALTILFLRIILVTPIWILLTLPPLEIITTKRIALVVGTIFLTWHSRPTQVSRAILWRSLLVRRICAYVTGLSFSTETHIEGTKPALPPRNEQMGNQQASLTAASLAASKRRPDTAGVRFTFILYENQRRWVGLGWTTSLFAYERAAWTDEHLSSAPSREDFELPDVEGGHARWRWVKGSQWLVEGAASSDEGGTAAKIDAADGGQGWIYYDNKWQNGRRGQDGWGRYTRRRKWYRDAELVEVTESTEITPACTPPLSPTTSQPTKSAAASTHNSDIIPTLPPRHREMADNASITSGSSLKSVHSGGLRPGASKRMNTSGKTSAELAMEREMEMDDHRGDVRGGREGDWGIGDEARMGLE